MGTEILNQHPYFVFIILAETLEGWKDLTSEDGKKVLMEHCRWGSEMNVKFIC
jgi:hypothetical protein